MRGISGSREGQRITRWGPLLRPKEQETRLTASREFLSRWETEGTSFAPHALRIRRGLATMISNQSSVNSLKTGKSPLTQKAR